MFQVSLMFQSRRLVFSSACSALLLAAALVAQRGAVPREATWPHWRGPLDTGVALTDAPTRWSDATNVAWKVEIPGRGHSSPAVWGDRILLTTAVPTGRREATPAEPAAGAGRGGRRGGSGAGGGSGGGEEHRFEVLALDRASGAVVWRHIAATAAPHEGYHGVYGSFASHSPVTDGRRVFASFGSRGLFAYDMDGQPQWQKDFGVQMRMLLQFGEGTAPVLDGDRLIMLFDHEGGSFIAMLDAATGRELWRTPRDEGSNWSTPLVATHAGRKQIVVSATRRVRSYDFETGRLIWEAAGLGRNTIPRPVQHQDLVLVMSGYQGPALMAIRLGREGDLTGTDAIVWSTNRGTSYTASPALHDGKLYFVTDSGMVSCLDAATGTPIYQQVRLPKPYNFKASPVIAGGKLYLSTEEGDVVVAAIGPALDVIATNTLTGQSFIATPAVAGGEMFLRSRTHLFRITPDAR
jgi:outer membrane protein assembly factor BamB